MKVEKVLRTQLMSKELFILINKLLQHNLDYL